MDEKQKAAAGYLYDANYDVVLQREREACKDLCFAFNACKPSDTAGQQRLLRQIIGKTSGSFCVTAPFWCDYGYNITIGEHFYANHNCIILDGAKVTFGDNVFIAPNCCFSTAGHSLDVEQRNQGLEIALPITVGNNVWFGAGVTVLPGITIGDNTVIGAGSVVNRDIPSGVVAVGNPCRVVRAITEADKAKYPIWEEKTADA